jgi:hypothetical protein
MADDSGATCHDPGLMETIKPGSRQPTAASTPRSSSPDRANPLRSPEVADRRPEGLRFHREFVLPAKVLNEDSGWTDDQDEVMRTRSVDGDNGVKHARSASGRPLLLIRPTTRRSGVTGVPRPCTTPAGETTMPAHRARLCSRLTCAAPVTARVASVVAGTPGVAHAGASIRHAEVDISTEDGLCHHRMATVREQAARLPSGAQIARPPRRRRRPDRQYGPDTGGLS